MVGARIEAKGLDKVAKNLAEMIERAKDLTAPLQAGAEAIKLAIDNSFRRQQAPDGTAWEPLSEATIKSRRGGSSQALIDTGDLRGRAFARVDSPTSITFGDNAEYAAAQNYGFTRTGTYATPQTNPSAAPRGPRKPKSVKLGVKTRARQATSTALGAGSRFGTQHAKTGNYTITVPARPFIPVDESGDVVRVGAMGKALQKMERAILKYIRTGNTNGG